MIAAGCVSANCIAHRRVASIIVNGYIRMTSSPPTPPPHSAHFHPSMRPPSVKQRVASFRSVCGRCMHSFNHSFSPSAIHSMPCHRLRWCRATRHQNHTNNTSSSSHECWSFGAHVTCSSKSTMSAGSQPSSSATTCVADSDPTQQRSPRQRASPMSTAVEALLFSATKRPLQAYARAEGRRGP